jgi:hypothetical protein
MGYHFLESGRRYGVIRPFVDYDRQTHPVGEQWTFLRSSFLPYDDGLSLFVSVDGKAERQIRLQWRYAEQGPIIDHFAEYVAPLPA